MSTLYVISLRIQGLQGFFEDLSVARRTFHKAEPDAIIFEDPLFGSSADEKVTLFVDSEGVEMESGGIASFGLWPVFLHQSRGIIFYMGILNRLHGSEIAISLIDNPRQSFALGTLAQVEQYPFGDLIASD